jgi:hypothetical protein
VPAYLGSHTRESASYFVRLRFCGFYSSKIAFAFVVVLIETETTRHCSKRLACKFRKQKYAAEIIVHLWTLSKHDDHHKGASS